MNTIFIIGAGASRELFFRTTVADVGDTSKLTSHQNIGPLSSGFFYYANEFIKETKKISSFASEVNISNPWLEKFIEEFYFKENKCNITLNELKNNELKSKNLNIEKLYVALENKLSEIIEKRLDKRWPTQEEVDACLARKDLLEYIHKIFSTIPFYCYSIYHRILINYIISIGGDIICFNWDTLLEEEMYDTGQWDYLDGYGFKAGDFIDKNATLPEAYRYRPRGIQSKNKILKPHGSINWYQKREAGMDSLVDTPNEIYVTIPLTRQGAFRGGIMPSQGQLRFYEIKNRNKNQTYESLIIPPGRKRKKFDFIWVQTKSLLKNADEIISIGFSFNEFDSHITDIFNKEVEFKKDLTINVINPDLNTIEKYKNIFKTNKVNRIFNYFGDYCEWIVKQKGMEKFLEVIKK